MAAQRVHKYTAFGLLSISWSFDTVAKKRYGTCMHASSLGSQPRFEVTTPRLMRTEDMHQEKQRETHK
jgi:hypothetical protein